MSSWFGSFLTKQEDVPEVHTISPQKRPRMKDDPSSPITSKMSPKSRKHHHHHAKKMFSPHKRRGYEFERRRKLSMDDDTEPWMFVKYIQEEPYQPFEGPNRLPPLLSNHQERGTLVLDLDETLVHCCTSPLPEPDTIFSVKFAKQKFKVYAKFRPFLQEFLERVASDWEIVVYTASQPAYANKMLDIIDKKGVISYRLFRNDCTNVNGNYVKDLTSLGRDLSKTVIVDNSPQCFAYQIYNGIAITSWYEDRNDDELIRLADLLSDMKDEKDYRAFLNEEFHLDQNIADISPMEYMQFLTEG